MTLEERMARVPRNVKFGLIKPDTTPMSQYALVEIMACLEAARASALPLKERDAYLIDFTNRVETISRKAKGSHVKAFTRAFAIRLMEMGH
jgi:hypothetical protein